MQDGDDRLSRRRLLQTSGVTLTTATLAGCSGLLPGGGDSGSGGDGEDGEETTEEEEETTTTESGLSGTTEAASRIMDFIAVPDEIASLDHLTTTRIDPVAIDDSDELQSYTQSNWNGQAGVGINSVDDINMDDFERVVGFQVGSVAIGKVNREDIVEALEDDDLDEDSTYNGFTLYEGDLGYSEAYVAVSNASGGMLSVSERNIVITASDQSYNADDPEDAIEALIDAGRGEADRYRDEEDAFKDLATAMQGQDYQQFYTQDQRDYGSPSNGSFEDAVGRGIAYDMVGEEDATVNSYIVFDEEDDVDMDDIDDYIDDNLEDSYYYDYEDLEATQDGRKVTVTGTIATDEL